VTLSLLLAVYAIVDGNEAGWGSRRPRLLLAAAALMALFLVIELRSSHPLMPLGLFKLRNLLGRQHRRRAVGGGHVRLVLPVGALHAAGARTTRRWRWALAFLPANLIMGAFSLGLSAKLVTRFGIRAPLASGCCWRRRASRCSRARRSTAASGST
jgi:hypothetical protein